MTQFYRNARFDFDAAQSIFAAFKGQYNVPNNCSGICGSKNVCGALYAASWLRPDLEDIFVQEYKTYAGAVTCLDIMAAHKLNCLQCVQLAEQLLVDYLEKPIPLEE